MNFPKEKSDKVQGLRNWLSSKSHLSGDPGWGLVIHQEYVRARHPDPQKAFSSSHFLASCQSKASEENLVVMRCVLLDYFHSRENWVSKTSSCVSSVQSITGGGSSGDEG